MSWNISVPNSEYYDHNSPGLEPLIRELSDQREISIDTETTGLVTWKDLPLYWSLSWGNRRATLNASVLPLFQKSVFDDASKRWILTNAKYDAHILANVGINLTGELRDIAVMHALLYEEQSHGLKDMAEHILGWRWSDFQDTFGKIGAKQSATDVIRRAEAENFPLLVEYAANDAWGTLNIYHQLSKQLQEAGTDSLFCSKPPYIKTLWDLFEKVEVPFTKVLWKCERNGILVDTDYLQKIAPDAEAEIAQLERDIVREVGHVINPNSPAQLRAYFFDELGLPPIKMTKGGKTGVRTASVDVSFLEHYAATVPAAKMMLRHRELNKLKGTYIDGLSKLVDPHGRIHTRFNQDIARTGRLSSADPNLQNVPRVDNDKWKLRGAFISPPGHNLIVGDYEQLEMRLLACGSLESSMIDVIKKGWDIHMGNASMIFDLPYEDIEHAKKIEKKVKSGELPASEMTDYVKQCLDARASAKTIGFGLVYGMGVKKMANDLGISEDAAAQRIELFKSKYPAVDGFAEESINEARQYGYAFTVLGRRRNLPHIMSHSRFERLKAERQAVNTPIQGSAADVVKMAQILCDRAALDKKYGARMLLQVHDELVFECPEETTDQAIEEIRDWMEHPFFEDLAVPLGVDLNKGKSWLAAK